LRSPSQLKTAKMIHFGLAYKKMFCLDFALTKSVKDSEDDTFFLSSYFN